MEINSATIQDAIVKEVSERIFDEMGIHEMIEKKVTTKIDTIFTETVDAQIQREIEKAVSGGFEREYHKVNSFGNPQGEATTISKELERIVSTYWQQKVDRSGKPTDSSYSAGTRAEWMMLQVCGDDFKDRLKQEMANVSGNLKDGLRDQLRTWTDQTLGNLFNVRSAHDQAEGRSK
jgi:hypothetical protein